MPPRPRRRLGGHERHTENVKPFGAGSVTEPEQEKQAEEKKPEKQPDKRQPDRPRK